MSTSLKNGSITTGGTAQDALPERLGRTTVVVQAQDEDMFVNFGTNAAIDTGYMIPVRAEVRFEVWKFPEVGGRVSIISPSTGAKYEIQDI